MKPIKIIKRKIIVSLILIITIFSFITPNYVQANVWNDAGGALFEPVFKFTRFLGDSALSFMQKAFLGDGNLETNALTGTNNDTKQYQIRYSPGKIFSGEVPLLDINFIKPNMEEVKVTTIPEYKNKGTVDPNSNSFKTSYGFDLDTAEIYACNSDNLTLREKFLGNENTYVMYKWTHGDKNYAAVSHTKGVWTAIKDAAGDALNYGGAGVVIGSLVPVPGATRGRFFNWSWCWFCKSCYRSCNISAAMDIMGTRYCNNLCKRKWRNNNRSYRP